MMDTSDALRNYDANSSTMIQEAPPPQLFADPLALYVTQFLYGLSAIVCIFGFVSNALNIRIFRELGLTTTSNICFFFLAVVDLLSVMYTALHCAHNLLQLDNAELFFPMFDILYFLSSFSYACLAFGSWVTAIISMERSCSVVFPLKVKRIFTKRSVSALLIGMALYQIATATPRFFSYSWTKVDNRTAYAIDMATMNSQLSLLSLTLSFSVPTYVCFILVVLGTIFLIISLKRSSKLRDRLMRADKSEESVTRDTKIIKAVILICSLYIAGFLVPVSQFIVSMIFPRMNFMDPEYGNIDKLLLHISYLTQAVSSSANIFVYLSMNSNYRKIFNKTVPSFSTNSDNSAVIITDK